MRRLLFEIAYRGTNYHGYQVQPNAPTVAETLQDAIEAVFRNRRSRQSVLFSYEHGGHDPDGGRRDRLK